MKNSEKTFSSTLYVIATLLMFIIALLWFFAKDMTDHDGNVALHGAIIPMISGIIAGILFLLAYLKQEKSQLFLLSACGTIALFDLIHLVFQLIKNEFYKICEKTPFNFMGKIYYTPRSEHFDFFTMLPALIELIGFIAVFTAALLLVLPKTKKWALKLWFVPIIPFIAYFVPIIIRFNGSNLYSTFPHEGFLLSFLGIAIAVLNAVVAFLVGVIVKQSVPQKIVDEVRATKAPKVVVQQLSSQADEIKKYKELLDAGIITQEEFESKKEELLGLQ